MLLPSDTIKYEIDKRTGFLMIDRPQKFSNIVPALYGFIPKTYCSDNVAEMCMQYTGKTGIKGDGDPLDILVLTERIITHGDILVSAIPIGGFRMIDDGEADDKIIAVLKGDSMYDQYTDVSEVPNAVIKRLEHYFLTYKQKPGEALKKIEITHTYGREEAHQVIKCSLADYDKRFGHLEQMLSEALRG